MILEVPRERMENILWNIEQENTAYLQQKVLDAHTLQKQRFVSFPYTANAQIKVKDMHQLIPLDTETKEFFLKAISSLHLSPRLVHRVQRIARTIADLAGAEHISSAHIAEALQYRARSYFVN